MSKAIPVKLPPADFGPPPPRGVELVHLSPMIGTEILGIDLTQPLGPDLHAFLDGLLLARKVIFFRDQELSNAQHVAFGRNWGTLEITPHAEHPPGFPEIFSLRRGEGTASRENLWHADGTWRETPDLGAILLARVVPEFGGDTLFCDMSAAYDDLPDWLKRALEGLVAVHSMRSSRSLDETVENLTEMERRYPPQRHPVIRTHPRTGRRLIFVNSSYTSHIEGMGFEESQFLLSRLYRQAGRPEFQCRFRWRRNSIAFWDNRACQHYGAADYGDAPRVMDRITLVGDRPV